MSTGAILRFPSGTDGMPSGAGLARTVRAESLGQDHSTHSPACQRVYHFGALRQADRLCGQDSDGKVGDEHFGSEPELIGQ